MVTQDAGTGVLDVTGSGEENEGLVGSEPEQVVDSAGCGWVPQLGLVASGELGEPLRVVAVPSAKVSARRCVLEPLVQVGVGLLDAAGPQPVDEDPVAGSPRVVVVDAAYLRVTMLRSSSSSW